MTHRRTGRFREEAAYPRGPYFYGEQYLPEHKVTEGSVTQHENDEHRFINGTYVDALLRRLLMVYRGGADLSVGELFRRNVDTLDMVLDSTSWSKVISGYVNSGRIAKLLRLSADEDPNNLFKRGGNSLDDVLDSATYGRVLSEVLYLGRVYQLLRGGLVENADNLFKKGSDTLDQVLDSPTWKRIVSSYVTAEGKIAFIFRSLVDESGNNLFKKNSDTLSSVGDDGTYRRLAAAFTDTVWRLIGLWHEASQATFNTTDFVRKNIDVVSESQLPASVVRTNRSNNWDASANTFGGDLDVVGKASVGRLQGRGTVQVAKDQLYLGPDAPNLFLDRPVAGKFIFNYNSPKNASTGDAVFEVYNNATDRKRMFWLEGRGTTGGLDQAFLSVPTTFQSDVSFTYQPTDPQGNPFRAAILTGGSVNTTLTPAAGTLQIVY